MKFVTFDNLLISVFLGLAALSGYKLFFAETRAGRTAASEVHLASIGIMTNKVRLKPASHLAWRDMAGAERLFRSDQVFTGAKSTAKINFADGFGLSTNQDNPTG